MATSALPQVTVPSVTCWRRTAFCGPSSAFCTPSHRSQHIRQSAIRCRLHQESSLRTSSPGTTLRLQDGRSEFLRGRLAQPHGCTDRRKVIAASFFGVGAPEALLVAVVSLIVFGPKGLAEARLAAHLINEQAVKSLGKALKTFQPTIREIASVSSDLRSTLEEQIGLDEIRNDFRSGLAPEPRRRPSAPQADSQAEPSGQRGQEQDNGLAPGVSASHLAAQMDPDIDRKRAEASAAAWGGPPPAQPADVDSLPAPSADSTPATAISKESPGDKQLTAMSVEELEAELARRKAMRSSQA